MRNKAAFSELHCTSCAVHQNHIIRRVIERTFRDHGIVFQSMNGVVVLNEHGGLYFLSHEFGVHIIPF